MPENPRIEELRRRVEADPASIAFAALAEEYRRLGRYDEAIGTCLAGLQRHPAYLSARVTLGRALMETGDLDSAREQFEIVLRAAPENIAATRGLAQIHERLGHAAEMDPHLAQLMREHTESVARPEPPQVAITAAPIAAPQADTAPEPAPAAYVELERAVPVEAEPAVPLELEAVRPQPAEPETAHLQPAPPERAELETLEPAAIEPAVIAPVALEATAIEPETLDLGTLDLETLDLGRLDLGTLEPGTPEPRTLEPRAFEPAASLAPLAAVPHIEPEPLPDVPDPAVIAAIAGLERFLSAIHHARHA